MTHAPGWQPDPEQRHLQRWWNGAAWTADVVDDDPVPVPPSSPRPATVGWHPDPSGRFRDRYFDGSAWTSRVAFREPVPPPPGAAPSHAPAAAPPQPASLTGADHAELAALAYTREFLADAFGHHDIDQPTYARLVRRVADTRHRIVSGTPAPTYPAPTYPAPTYPAARPPAVPRPAPTPHARPQAAPTPRPGATTPAAPVVPAEPGPPTWTDLAREWLAETFRTVRSDLAVHGLAYLGVLLLFAGVFGFVAFSFAEVDRSLRPIAEVAIPAAIFLAAWFLRRRSAPYVSDALELLGGAVLPIVCFASLVDGSDIPDDLTGGPLEIALASIGFALAALYAWITVRRPTSTLRFLVAPLVWLGVMMATLATDPNLRGGEQITRPVPWQTAATILAILVTALVVRRFRGHVLADASSTVVLPGVAVVAVLQVLASAREGWPVGPTILAGIGTLAVIEVEHRRLGDAVTVALQGAVLAGALAMLGPRIDGPWLGTVGVVTFLLLAEWEGTRRPSVAPLPALLVAAAAGVVVATFGAWAAVVAFATASAWTLLRRIRPRDWAPPTTLLHPLGALLPAGIAYGLLRALEPVPATLVIVALVLVAAVATRAVGTRAEPFASWWTTGAAALALGLVAATASADTTDADLARLAGAAAALGVAFVLTRTPGALRVWTVAAAWTLAAGLGFAAAGTDPGTAAIAAAGVGLALVAVALARRVPVGGDLGIVGHVVSMAALVPAGIGGGWAISVVLGLVATGWIVTTVAQETVGSRTVERLGVYEHAAISSIVFDTSPNASTGGGVAPWLPPIAAFLSLSYFVPELLDQTGWVRTDTDGMLGVAAAMGLVYATVVRLVRGHLRPAGVGSWTAWAVALLALPAASDAVGAATAAAAIGTIVVIPRERRALIMEWTAWLVSGLVVVRGALAAGLPDDEYQVALFAWGAAVSILVVALDRRRAGDRRTWLVVRDGRAIVPLGAGVVALGLSITRAWSEGPGSFGWWTLALAAVVLAWAILADVTTWAVVAAALAADAAARLLPWPLPDQPWNLLVAVGTLSVVAAVLQRLGAARTPAEDRARAPVVLDERGWLRVRPDLRWAWPPFIVANGAAAAMVVVAEQTTTPAATYLAVGAWALLVGAWTRAWPWLAAGAVLVNVGAGRAGSGWLTLTLLLTALAATVAATRVRRPARFVLQLTGAAALAGAWVSGAWWLDVGTTAGLRAGAITAGAVVLAAAVVLRRRWLATDWVATWAGVALGSLAATGVVALQLEDVPATLGIGIGVLLVGAAAGIAATPLGQPALRDTAALLVAGGVGLVLFGADATPTQSIATAWGIGTVAVLGTVPALARHVRSAWFRPAVELAALAAGGALVVNAYAVHPDAGWFALTFVLVAAVAAVATTFTPTPAHEILQLTAVSALAGAWVAGAWWLDIGMTAGITAGAITAGAVVVLSAVALRRELLARDWIAAWAGVGVAAVAAAAWAAAELGLQDAATGVGIGIVLIGVASAVGARPTGYAPLRDLSALLVAVGGATILLGVDAGPAAATAVACGVGFVAVVGAAVFAYRRPESPWATPTVELAVLATLGAVSVGATQLPDRSLLVPTLAVAGTYSAVVGVVTRRAAFLLVAPFLLCAAWLTFATEALAGNPEWITVPIGVTILVVNGLLRATLRRRGEDPAQPAIVGVDLVGMAFVVGAALVQTIVESLWYGVLAVGLGALVATWGLVSRVRRRALFGSVTVVLAVVLLVGIPLVDVALSASEEGGSVVSGPALWIVIAAIGLLAIMVAAFLEQGRQRVRAVIKKVSTLTQDWE